MDSTEVTVVLKFDDNMNVDMDLIPDGSKLIHFYFDDENDSIIVTYEPPLEV